MARVCIVVYERSNYLFGPCLGSKKVICWSLQLSQKMDIQAAAELGKTQHPLNGVWICTNYRTLTVYLQKMVDQHSWRSCT